MRARLAWPIFVLLFYGVLTVWLLWPYPLRAGQVMMHRGDPIHQLWTLRWTQHALFHDPAGLFAANVNYPYDAALTLNQPTYTNALLTAPVYALTHNQALTYNAGVLLSFVLAGAFTALLVQQLTGSRWAALAAGVLYAFAPVRQAHIYHLNLLSGYWTPLALWGLHRLWQMQNAKCKMQKGSGQANFYILHFSFCIVLIIALALAAQVLAEFYHAVYLALAVLLFLLWQLVTRRWGLTRRGTLLLATAGLLGLLLTLPVVVPTARAWSALDLRRTVADHDAYSARLENYLVTDRPMRLSYGLGRFNHQSPTSGAAEHSLYPGLLTLPLALAGVFAARRRGARDALLYLLIAVAAVYLSLGPTIRLGEGAGGIASPLYRWLYDHVPGFQGARVPSRWAMLAQLALAVLAGYGVAALVALGPGRRSSATDAASLIHEGHEEHEDQFHLAHLNLSGLRDLRGFRILWHHSGWASGVGALLLVALALDFWGPPIGGTTEVVGDPVPQVYQALAAQPPGAVLEYPLVNADEMLVYRYEYYSTFHWRPLVNSGSSIVPQAYIELRDALGTFPEPRAVALLQALDVRYVVVHRYEMSGWSAWWQRAQAAPGVRVLARTTDKEDVLLAIDPNASPPDLVADRWPGADGQTHVLLTTGAPLVLDRTHLYERRHPTPVELEHLDGRIERVEAELPTYLLGGVAELAWPDLPEDVAALRLETARGPLRVPLSAAPRPERAVEGPQLVGPSLPASVPAGTALPCMLYGKGPLAIPGLVLSLNLLDGDGQLRAKQDRFFDEGFAPPDHWPSRGVEPVPCDLPIPADLPPGRYTFTVGLYDPAGARFIPFADPAGNVAFHWSRPIAVTAAR